MTREQIQEKAKAVVADWKAPPPIAKRTWEGVLHAAETGELINNEDDEVVNFLFWNGAS
jgi:hypothetical protein